MIRREFLGVGFAVLDFLLSYGVWLGFYFLRRDLLYSYQSGLPPTLWEYLWGPLIVGGYWVVLFLLGGLYKDPLRQSFLRRLWQRLWLSILGSLALFFVAFIDDPIPNYKLYYKTLSYYILLQFGVLLIGDVLLYAFIRYSLRRKRLRFPTILIGQGEKAYKIWQELTNNPFGTVYDIIGYVTPYSDKPNLLSGKLRHLGRLEELESILHRRSPHQVVIAVEEAGGGRSPAGAGGYQWTAHRGLSGPRSQGLYRRNRTVRKSSGYTSYSSRDKHAITLGRASQKDI
jgi:FlaA1/EpsC-like NDP-sugar epimerase